MPYLATNFDPQLESWPDDDPSLWSKLVAIQIKLFASELVVIVNIYKGKGLPQQAEVVLGVLGRLWLRIFSTSGTTRVVGRQPNAPAAFTPGEIPGTYFQRLSQPQGTWFCRKEPRKKSQVTPPGIDPETVRLVYVWVLYFMDVWGFL